MAHNTWHIFTQLTESKYKCQVLKKKKIRLIAVNVWLFESNNWAKLMYAQVYEAKPVEEIRQWPSGGRHDHAPMIYLLGFLVLHCHMKPSFLFWSRIWVNCRFCAKPCSWPHVLNKNCFRWFGGYLEMMHSGMSVGGTAPVHSGLGTKRKTRLLWPTKVFQAYKGNHEK